MKSVFIKILDFYLYSGFHIALAAVCIIMQVYLIFDMKAGYHYLLFIFASTSFLYLLHNLLGLNTLLVQCVRDKIKRIARMRVVLIVFLVLMGIISANSFFYLDTYKQITVIILAAISLWYVVPVKGKRLRDFPLIKIFLIAMVWSAVACIAVFPVLKITVIDKFLLFAERFLIVFAITIPFDVRDMDYDTAQGLSTLPLLLGKTKSIILAIVSVAAAMLIVAYLHHKGIYGENTARALELGYTVVIIMIYFSKDRLSDYYFTGILDSTAIIICFLLWLLK